MKDTVMKTRKAKVCYLTCVMMLIFVLGCKRGGELRSAAPEATPHTEKYMESAAFWIKQHPFPDRIILSPEEISDFNNKTEAELKLIKDVTKIGPTYPNEQLALRFKEDAEALRKEKLYDRSGMPAGKDFYDRVDSLVGLKKYGKDVKVSYGFILRASDQRILPTDQALTKKPNDLKFDEIQNDQLDIGTPLAILWDSGDKKWVYADAPYSRGWVKREKIVFCTIREMKDFLARKPFVVAISPFADMFVDSGKNKFYGRIRMGACLPLAGEDADMVKVIVPARGADSRFYEKALYISKGDVNPGFIAYTPGNIIRQAFKLFGTAYGWGSSDGGVDCSALLREVFATAGIKLPRNTAQQRFVGRLVAEFKKEGNSKFKVRALARRSIGGITAIYLKGHIMLFLGTYGYRPYAIHAAYSYKERTPRGIVKRIVNKVIVSDFSLGESTPKLSLLERIRSIRIIDKE